MPAMVSPITFLEKDPGSNRGPNLQASLPEMRPSFPFYEALNRSITIIVLCSLALDNRAIS